jgi:hypothetical protein
VKNDSTSKPSNYKARLVVRGFEQKEGLDFQETFILVIKWSTIRNVIALVVHFGWKISQMDVKTTFLNFDLKEEVYMRQLQGFVKFGSKHLVCKLNKVFYGLCQAPQASYKKIDNFLKILHMTKCRVDPNFYLWHNEGNILFVMI